MRRFLTLFTLFSLLFTQLFAQDRAHTLKVYNWADYLDLDLIEEFEEWYEATTGEPVKIIYSTFDINENMLTEIEVGHEDYDVVCPSEYIIERMLKRHLLQKIDTTDFTRTSTENNLHNVSPWAVGMFQEMAPDSLTCVSDYTVGYMWGTTGLLYNRAFVSEDEVQSWSALHNPRFYQQIYVKDAFRDIYSVLICAARHEEILDGKVSRQNLATDLSDSNIQAVQQYLMKAKPQIAGWEADFGKERMCQGKVWLNATWSGDAQWAIDEEEEDVDLAYIVPMEGSNAWFDGWVIPVYAQNTKAASYWINFLCSSENAVRNMEETGYVSVIATEAVLDSMINEECDTLDASYFFGEAAKAVPLNHVYYPDQSVIDRCVLMHDTAERNEAMLEMWSRVKGDNLNWKMLTFICIVLLIIAISIITRKYNEMRRKKLRRQRLAKLTTIAVLLSLSPSLSFAQSADDESEDGLSVSAEVVSHYNWRGLECYGPSFQPDITWVKGGFTAEAWFSFGADSWDFNEFSKELDLTLTYSFKQLELSLTSYYYLEGNPFDYNLENEYGNQLEAGIRYDFPNTPFHLSWNTIFAGNDQKITDPGVGSPDPYVIENAFSTYIEAGCEWEFEKPSLTLATDLGITPWASQYSNYDKAGVCNLSLRLDKSWSLSSGTLSLFGQVAQNFTTSTTLWCLGAGFAF